jgi:hypothetical protein
LTVKGRSARGTMGCRGLPACNQKPDKTGIKRIVPRTIKSATSYGCRKTVVRSNLEILAIAMWTGIFAAVSSSAATCDRETAAI